MSRFTGDDDEPDDRDVSPALTVTGCELGAGRYCSPPAVTAIAVTV